MKPQPLTFPRWRPLPPPPPPLAVLLAFEARRVATLSAFPGGTAGKPAAYAVPLVAVVWAPVNATPPAGAVPPAGGQAAGLLPWEGESHWGRASSREADVEESTERLLRLTTSFPLATLLAKLRAFNFGSRCGRVAMKNRPQQTSSSSEAGRWQNG